MIELVIQEGGNMANRKQHPRLEAQRLSFRVPQLVHEWIQFNKEVNLTKVCRQAIYNLPEYQEWVKGQMIEGQPAVEFAVDRGVKLLP